MIKAVLSAGGLLAAVALAVVLLGGIPKDKVNGSLSKIQTVGLTEQSIEIVGPTETAFDALMSKQSQKIKSRDLRALKSSSVFVINKSGQSIAAMSVNWELVQPDGGSVSHATAHQGGLGIASEGGPPQLMEDIAPNGNRLFSLLDLPDSNQGFGYRTGGGPDKARQLAESVKVIVSIDGVLFADGTFVGPDRLGYFGTLKAEIDARRDLVEEMARALNGDSDAMKHIESMASGRRELTRSSSNHDTYYDAIKETQASFMLARRRKVGDKVLLDALNVELSKPRITLRKLETN